MTEPPTISAGSFTEQPNAFCSTALRSPVLLAVLLILLTAAAYAPVIHCDFVNYDDSDYLTANTYVQQGFRWENIRWAFTSGHAANWHPVTWLAHMLDWQLFGPRPAGHHLVNLLLHLVNTVLVFVLFARLTGAPVASLLLAAV